MRRTTTARGLLAGAAAAMFLTVGAAPANAERPDLGRLVELTPGASERQVRAAVRELAAGRGVSFAAAVEQALLEAERATSESSVASSSPPPSASSASSRSGTFGDKGGGTGTVVLGSALRKGDLFWTPSSTAGIEHGHAGIYYTTTSVVEAPGAGEVSRLVPASERYVAPGARKQEVAATTAQRDVAADHANGSMLGRDYNFIFFANKTYDGPVNCSQLVWAAYRAATGIDLDGNGGWGVYPNDIRDSPLVSTYATL